MDKNKCVCTVNLFVYIVNLRRKKKGWVWNRSWRPGQSDYVFCVFIVYFVWLGCNCELDVTNEVHWWGNESIIMFGYCLIVMGAIVNVVIILFNVPTAGVVTTATKWSRMDNIIAGFQGIGRSTQTRLQGATSIGTQLCPGHSGMQIWVDFSLECFVYSFVGSGKTRGLCRLSD